MKSDEVASTIHHLRPGLWPFVWAHCLAGFVAAHGEGSLALDAQSWLQGLVAGGNWAVLLGGPAVLLTAFFDPLARDDTGGAPRAPAPRSAAWSALALLLLGLTLSSAISWDYFDACLLGVVLLILHAAPPVRLAAVAYGAPAVQAIGYGALTFYAGYSASGVLGAGVSTAPLYMLGFVFLFLASRLLLGPAAMRAAPWRYWSSLGAAVACLCVAHILAGNRWSLALLAPPLAAWCVIGIHRYGRGSVEDRLSWSAVLSTWLLTDAAVALSALLR